MPAATTAANAVANPVAAEALEAIGTPEALETVREWRKREDAASG